MSEPEKRPWFRFHLLTMVLMTLAAGALLWENVKRFRYSPAIYGAAHHELGWPWTGMYFWTPNVRPINAPAVEYRYLNGWAFAADFGCAMTLVIAVAFLSECILRRREARKT